MFHITQLRSLLVEKMLNELSMIPSGLMRNQKVKYFEKSSKATGNSARNKKKFGSFRNSNFGSCRKRRQGFNTNQNDWMKSAIK